jgi:hypothetical protein
MKKQLNFLLIISLLTVSSCDVVSSISPLSTDKNELVFEKKFIGKWKELKNSPDYCSVDTVPGSNSRRYLITAYSHNQAKAITDISSFYGEIVNLNGWEFLDCWFTTSGKCISKDQEDYLINKHFIFHVSFRGKDSLSVAIPSAEELKKLIDGQKINLHYTTLKGDDYILLDKPDVLQNALEATKKYPLIYKDKSILVRLP